MSVATFILSISAIAAQRSQPTSVVHIAVITAMSETLFVCSVDPVFPPTTVATLSVFE